MSSWCKHRFHQKKWYREVAFVLLATIMLSAVGAVGSSAVQTEPATLLILGDSIATGHSLEDYNSQGNPKSRYSWATLLAESYAAKQINLAVDGDTTANLLEVVQAPAKRNTIAQADVICISIGGNNFLQLMGQLFAAGTIFTPDAVDSAYAEVQAAAQQDLDDIFAKLHSINPEAKILVQTLFAPYRYFTVEIEPGKTIAEWMGVYVDRYNAMLKERAEAVGVTVVDVGETFKTRGQESWLYASMSDGTLNEAILALAQANPHPTKEGHRAIFETYCETADALLTQALASKPVSSQTEEPIETEEPTVTEEVSESEAETDEPPTDTNRPRGKVIAIAAGIGVLLAATVGACAVVLIKKNKKK